MHSCEIAAAGLCPLTIIRLKRQEPRLYCCSYKLAVATTTVVRNASYSQNTRPHRRDRGKEPSGSRCRHAL
eukprot:2547465-Pleurochrysis_carterae.AAC.1